MAHELILIVEDVGRKRASAMNRRAFVSGLGGVLAAPLASDAEQAGKTPSIGVLVPVHRP